MGAHDRLRQSDRGRLGQTETEPEGDDAERDRAKDVVYQIFYMAESHLKATLGNKKERPPRQRGKMAAPEGAKWPPRKWQNDRTGVGNMATQNQATWAAKRGQNGQNAGVKIWPTWRLSNKRDEAICLMFAPHKTYIFTF